MLTQLTYASVIWWIALQEQINTKESLVIRSIGYTSDHRDRENNPDSSNGGLTQRMHLCTQNLKL